MDARRDTIFLARALRSKTSLPEGILWQALRGRQLEGLKFRRQHPAGPYGLDFYCAAAQLAVEIDGQSHGDPDQRTHDAIRDSWLARRGIRVLRIPASVILSDMTYAIDAILDAVGSRRGNSAPSGGGGPPGRA